MIGVNAGVHNPDPDALAGKARVPNLRSADEGDGNIQQCVDRLVEPNRFDIGARREDTNCRETAITPPIAAAAAIVSTNGLCLTMMGS
jgi:hypothetical protein